MLIGMYFKSIEKVYPEHHASFKNTNNPQFQKKDRKTGASMPLVFAS